MFERGRSESSESAEENVTEDADRKLGFGPYANFTYEEVLISKPDYVKFLVEEGRRGNLQGRFTRWAMASMVDAFSYDVKKKDRRKQKKKVGKISRKKKTRKEGG